MTLTLTEFLLARFDEDEQRAKAAGHGCGYVMHEHSGGWVEVDLPVAHNARPAYELRQIRAWSPARVLAEVEAKRRIVALHAVGDDGRCGECSDKFCVTPWNGICEVAALLTLPYADHPDYNPEWRP